MLEFHRNHRNGKYEGCRYPNLVEIYGHLPTSYFANVTEELMLAVFEGKEDLTAEEICKIARYNGIPVSVLLCPTKILLSRERRRHWDMLSELHEKLCEIWEWQKKGSRAADSYMKYRRGHFVNMDLDFRNRRPVSYGRYLWVKHEMEDALLFIRNEQDKVYNKPRGLPEQIKEASDESKD